ncbi:hypothetical protein Ccrd_020735 [Cynara cardunculus var. scolymus]|uniref:Transmembrane protein n=1 Tax=Cynara cardunculus var. scolymus TaxID=59895 RepID=A0A103Y1X2_CYNCS|nr:hypothetical protein Ccrd_020735 [Cynara cardunculus var. scolymus]
MPSHYLNLLSRLQEVKKYENRGRWTKNGVRSVVLGVLFLVTPLFANFLVQRYKLGQQAKKQNNGDPNNENSEMPWISRMQAWAQLEVQQENYRTARQLFEPKKMGLESNPIRTRRDHMKNTQLTDSIYFERSFVDSLDADVGIDAFTVTVKVEIELLRI